jgi:hypothetical protein
MLRINIVGLLHFSEPYGLGLRRTIQHFGGLTDSG